MASGTSGCLATGICGESSVRWRTSKPRAGSEKYYSCNHDDESGAYSCRSLWGDSCVCLGQQHFSHLLPFPPAFPSRRYGTQCGYPGMLPRKILRGMMLWCILVHFGNKLVALQKSAVFTFVSKNFAIILWSYFNIFGSPMVIQLISHWLCSQAMTAHDCQPKTPASNVWHSVTVARHQNMASFFSRPYTNGRAYATVLRPSTIVCLSVCDITYCG